MRGTRLAIIIMCCCHCMNIWWDLGIISNSKYQSIYDEWRIYASVNYAIILSDNGWAPVRLQAITGNNDGLLSIGLLETNLNEILIEVQIFSLKKMHLKMLSLKLRPFCLREMHWRLAVAISFAHISLFLIHWGLVAPCGFALVGSGVTINIQYSARRHEMEISKMDPMIYWVS